jgi:hypothetical protein
MQQVTRVKAEHTEREREREKAIVALPMGGVDINIFYTNQPSSVQIPDRITVLHFNGVTDSAGLPVLRLNLSHKI